MTISCLVIDDHYLFRRGLIGTLVSLPGVAVVGEANSVERALAVRDEPDVVLLGSGRAAQAPAHPSSPCRRPRLSASAE